MLDADGDGGEQHRQGSTEEGYRDPPSPLLQAQGSNPPPQSLVDLDSSRYIIPVMPRYREQSVRKCLRFLIWLEKTI